MLDLSHNHTLMAASKSSDSHNIDSTKLIDELLTRSVANILPSREGLKKELLSGRKLRIYIGTDATGTSLHIGHATNYLTLEKFRRLGHKIILLIGDFTARIGDPTDKSAARVQLTREQVMENTKTWIKQISPVLNFNDPENPVEIVYNHDWLSKMTFEDIINLSSNFTVQQMLERDMFEKRLEENKPIYVHEFFYPLMQGFDSVHLDVDIELCGNDQTFNALTGRTLLKRYKDKEKFVFVTTLLENPVTKEKMMSKSQGTGVFLDESPNDMFGKIMAQADENIPQLFTDCTFVDMAEISKISAALKEGSENPKNIKVRLASEIVKIYHGEKAATEAEEYFAKAFSRKEMPENIESYNIAEETKLGDFLVEKNILASMSEFKRLIKEGAIKINGEESVSDFNFKVTETIGVKVGKKKFVRLTVA